MKWKQFDKMKFDQLSKPAKKALRTARKNGKPPGSAYVIAFKVENFTRAAKAKGIRKIRKRK